MKIGVASTWALAAMVEGELFGCAGGVLELFAAGGDGADPGALESAVGIEVVEDLAEVVGVCGGPAVQAAGADDLAPAGQGDGPGGLVAVAEPVPELDGEGEQGCADGGGVEGVDGEAALGARAVGEVAGDDGPAVDAPGLFVDQSSGPAAEDALHGRLRERGEDADGVDTGVVGGKIGYRPGHVVPLAAPGSAPRQPVGLCLLCRAGGPGGQPGGC